MEESINARDSKWLMFSQMIDHYKSEEVPSEMRAAKTAQGLMRPCPELPESIAAMQYKCMTVDQDSERVSTIVRQGVRARMDVKGDDNKHMIMQGAASATSAAFSAMQMPGAVREHTVVKAEPIKTAEQQAIIDKELQEKQEKLAKQQETRRLKEGIAKQPPNRSTAWIKAVTEQI